MAVMAGDGGSGSFPDDLERGQVRRGVVSSVARFGAFVDLGGFDGMISVINLSWTRFDHPAEIVRVGQEVVVTVLHVDSERGQVALSLKSLQPDPFLEFARTRLGSVLRGRVTKAVPIGVFVGVSGGVEGLLPLSELTGGGRHALGETPGVGDELVVEVADVNVDGRRVRFRLLADSPALPAEFPSPGESLGVTEERA